MGIIKARKLGGRNRLSVLYVRMTEPERINVWQDAWELAMYVKTTCLGTMIAELRAQMPEGRVMEHSSASINGEVKHYYRVSEITPSGSRSAA